MNADGDVVTGHVLVELKTGLGRKTATGRKASLDGPTLRQLLGYVLHDHDHDHDDTHGITAVGLYQALRPPGSLAAASTPARACRRAGRPAVATATVAVDARHRAVSVSRREATA